MQSYFKFIMNVMDKFHKMNNASKHIKYVTFVKVCSGLLSITWW